jgi:hypothetical protein
MNLTIKLLQNEVKLKFCEPLIRSLKAGLQKRFMDVMSHIEAQLAAVIHLKFKQECVNDVMKNRLTELLQ